jgi:hypothetical protein
MFGESLDNLGPLSDAEKADRKTKGANQKQLASEMKKTAIKKAIVKPKPEVFKKGTPKPTTPKPSMPKFKDVPAPYNPSKSKKITGGM